MKRYALFLVALGVVGAACSLFKIDNTNVNAPSQIVAPAVSPSAAASPSSASCPGTPDALRVGFYGADPCSIQNQGGVLPLGCTGLATVTPKLSGGSDDHRFDGSTPVWRVVSGPCNALSPGAESNPFNAFVSWLPGTAAGASCTVEANVCGATAQFGFTAK